LSFTAINFGKLIIKRLNIRLLFLKIKPKFGIDDDFTKSL